MRSCQENGHVKPSCQGRQGARTGQGQGVYHSLGHDPRPSTSQGTSVVPHRRIIAGHLMTSSGNEPRLHVATSRTCLHALVPTSRLPRARLRPPMTYTPGRRSREHSLFSSELVFTAGLHSGSAPRWPSYAGLHTAGLHAALRSSLPTRPCRTACRSDGPAQTDCVRLQSELRPIARACRCLPGRRGPSWSPTLFWASGSRSSPRRSRGSCWRRSRR